MLIIESINSILFHTLIICFTIIKVRKTSINANSPLKPQESTIIKHNNLNRSTNLGQKVQTSRVCRSQKSHPINQYIDNS